MKIVSLEVTEKLNLSDYRSFISVVPQNCILFTGSIKDNITYGLTNVSEERLNEVVRLSNIDEFAKLLDYHWELSQEVDSGSTNTLIDQIFESIKDYTAGKLVCGAGGGGFLQVVLKSGVSKETVRKTLKSVFQDSDVDIWDCEII